MLLSFVGVAIIAGLLGAWIAALVQRRERVVTVQATSSERKTEDTNASFALLVEALPLGVMFIDATGRVRFANQAAGTIFGFDVSRSIGNHVLASIPNVELERRIADALRG
jgi:PAS domain-containing protein